MSDFFSVKGVRPDTKSKFKKICNELALLQGECLSNIIDKYSQDPHSEKPSNLNIDKQLEIDNLDGVVKNLNNMIAELELDLKNLKLEFIDKQLEIDTLKSELENSQKTVASIKPGVEINGDQFVFDPKNLKKPMTRAIILADKRGKIDKRSADVLQQFTAKSINYYIKNEYPEVL